MKLKFMKASALLMAFMLSIGVMAGCQTQKYQGSLSCISCIENKNTKIISDMPEEKQRELISVLNEGNWASGVTSCAYDFEFTAKNQTLRYHSECGIFVDITNACSLLLSEDEKTQVNEIFGVKKIMWIIRLNIPAMKQL